MLKTQGILKVLLQNHQKPREFLVFDLGIYLKNISVFTLVFLNAVLFFFLKKHGFLHIVLLKPSKHTGFSYFFNG